MTRNSNIELCRIASILLVLLVHTNYSAIGWPDALDWTTARLTLGEAFSIIGVNVFVLITGFFSTTPKLKSMLNLCFIVVFYGLIRLAVHLATGAFHFSSLLFFSMQNWFILSYIGLVLLTPVLNAFVGSCSKSQLLKQIVMLLCLEFIADFLPGFDFNFHNGYSVLSFVILYLIGRYIKIYGLPQWVEKNSAPLYVALSLTLFAGACAILGLHLPKLALYHWFFYSNPLVIASSICFFMMFASAKERNSKAINHMAKSCLAVLLLHVPFEAPLWKPMQEFYQNLNGQFGVPQLLLWFAGLAVIFAICVLIDQVRILLWRPIGILVDKRNKA